MDELETTVTQKGQVTIPAEVRSRLGLKPRDKVHFEMRGDVVTLRPVPSRVLRWYGSGAPGRSRKIYGSCVRSSNRG